MLRETTSAANDAARLDDIEAADHSASGPELGSELRDASPEVRAAAVVRSRRLPEPGLMRDAWHSLPGSTQTAIGTAALTHSFYSHVSQVDPCALTLEAGRRCGELESTALSDAEAAAMAALPELYGTPEAEPAWAVSDTPLSFPSPYANLRSPTDTLRSRAAPPKVRAEAAARSRRIPGLDAIIAAWSRLPAATQDLLGVQAVAVAFYGWLGDDAMQEPTDRWLTDEAVGRCQRRSDNALNLMGDIAERSMPELYGTKRRDPAWARLDADPAALDAIWGAALPSPVSFAIALHRRTWQALQASSAFLDATGKADRKALAWPAEEAEDEALTDLLMLSVRSRQDAKDMVAHLTWYLGVRPQHPKGRALSEADGALIAVRLRDLGMILGREVPGAVPATEPGAMAGLIAAHRAAWNAYRAGQDAEAIGWDARFALRDAAGMGSEAVLLAPCADRAEASAFIEHARWYAAELEAAGEKLADGFGYEARQMRARTGDLAVHIGDSTVAGVPEGRA